MEVTRRIQWAKKHKGCLTTIKGWNMKVSIWKLKITNSNRLKTHYNKALNKRALRSRVLYCIKYLPPHTFKAKNPQKTSATKASLLQISSNMIQFNCLTQSLKRRIRTWKTNLIRWKTRWISSQIRLRNYLKNVRISDSRFTVKTLTFCL